MMNCALFFDVYGAGIARFEQYKRRNFPTLKPKAGIVKPEKKLNYINAIQQIRERYRENDYILTKGDTVAMQNVKYWLLCDYYAALERIIKEQERFEAEQSKNKK